MKHGLDGIEVFYPYPRFRKIVKFHSAKDVRKIADKYPQLLKTGGTDFHGQNKPHISLFKGQGEMEVPESILPEFLASLIR